MYYTMLFKLNMGGRFLLAVDYCFDLEIRQKKNSAVINDEISLSRLKSLNM